VLDDRAGETFDGQHTVFGSAEKGLEVLDRVEPDDVIVSLRIW
jgi:cyclophilin family peptidyl-prolyl cis-trans isomerase